MLATSNSYLTNFCHHTNRRLATSVIIIIIEYAICPYNLVAEGTVVSFQQFILIKMFWLTVSFFYLIYLQACRNDKVRKEVAAAVIKAITNNEVAKAAEIQPQNLVVRFSEA